MTAFAGAVDATFAAFGIDATCTSAGAEPVFLLVPQVKLPKRLHVARAAERWSGRLPALVERSLRSE